MAMISIEGTSIPSPTAYTVDTEPIGSFERNAKGKLVGDLIAIKTKVNCTWAAMTDDDLSKLKKAIAPFFIKVSFLDSDGTTTTAEMYSSPISAPLLKVVDGKMWWKNVTVNLIER